jgi:hypothetical protein
VKSLTPVHVKRNLDNQLAADPLSEWRAKYLHVGDVVLQVNSSTAYDCWLLRKDLYEILLAYLECPMSPKGFLYDAKEDIVLKYVIRPIPFAKILQLAQHFVYMLEMGNTEQQSLQS